MADLLERRWTLSILYVSFEGAARFNEYRAALGPVPPTTTRRASLSSSRPDSWSGGSSTPTSGGRIPPDRRGKQFGPCFANSPAVRVTARASGQPRRHPRPGDERPSTGAEQPQMAKAPALKATLVALVAALAAAPAASAAVTITTAGDAWTTSQFPVRNLGTQAVMRVNSKPVKRAFVRFDVATPGVTRAVLRLFAQTAGPRGFEVYSTSAAWAETTITHQSAPVPGVRLAQVPAFTATNTWREIDVTSAVTGVGPVSFMITIPSATADLTLTSKEGGRPPELVLETGNAPTPVSPPSVSGTAVVGQTLTAVAGADRPGADLLRLPVAALRRDRRRLRRRDWCHRHRVRGRYRRRRPNDSRARDGHQCSHFGLCRLECDRRSRTDPAAHVDRPDVDGNGAPGPDTHGGLRDVDRHAADRAHASVAALRRDRGACVEVTGAMGTTYLLDTPDLGSTIRVRETATNGQGTEAATSAATGVVVDDPPPRRMQKKLAGRRNGLRRGSTYESTCSTRSSAATVRLPRSPRRTQSVGALDACRCLSTSISRPTSSSVRRSWTCVRTAPRWGRHDDRPDPRHRRRRAHSRRHGRRDQGAPYRARHPAHRAGELRPPRYRPRRPGRNARRPPPGRRPATGRRHDRVHRLRVGRLGDGHGDVPGRGRHPPRAW